MSNRFLRLNRVSAVLIITFCAAMISVLVTTALLHWLGPEQANVNYKTALIISVSVPLVAAPVTSWPVMGLLIKIHNLESEMRQLANSDALTGLANRRHFFTQLNNQLEASTPACLLVLDIDFFKRINDQFGHQQGDTALIDLAQQLRSISQQTDCPARIGGEEFALLMANTDLASAEQIPMRVSKSQCAAPIALSIKPNSTAAIKPNSVEHPSRTGGCITGKLR